MELEVGSAEQGISSVVESVETVEVVAASEELDTDSASHHGLGMEHQIMVNGCLRAGAGCVEGKKLPGQYGGLGHGC